MNTVNVVGDGDLGLIIRSVKHLVGDLTSGNYAHALNDFTVILQEMQKALQPTVIGSSSENSEKVTEIVNELNSFVLNVSSVQGPEQVSGKVDWKRLLEILTKLLPFLIG